MKLIFSRRGTSVHVVIAASLAAPSVLVAGMCWRSGATYNCCTPSHIICPPGGPSEGDHWGCDGATVGGPFAVHSIRGGSPGLDSYSTSLVGTCTKQNPICGSEVGECSLTSPIPTSCSSTDPDGDFCW
ncbi:MAG: hypothetical protein JNM07_04190 [Phycisphaerae bacterium]|nr:hypothetical protein [Phycisphaerae bacterium]